MIAEKKLNSLNKINSSSLMVKASHVHKMHKQISVIRAIACLEYLGRVKILVESLSIKNLKFIFLRV